MSVLVYFLVRVVIALVVTCKRIKDIRHRQQNDKSSIFFIFSFFHFLKILLNIGKK